MSNVKVVKKSLKYSVIVKFINFDRKRLESRIIIVDGQPAIRIRGRIFTKIGK